MQYVTDDQISVAFRKYLTFKRFVFKASGEMIKTRGHPVLINRVCEMKMNVKTILRKYEKPFDA